MTHKFSQQNASANYIDPYKYLEYIFRQLPNLDFVKDNSVLDEYLPWSEIMQLEFRVKNTVDDEEKGALKDEIA